MKTLRTHHDSIDNKKEKKLVEQVYQAISFWSDLYFIYIEHLCIIYIYIEYFGPGACTTSPNHHTSTTVFDS